MIVERAQGRRDARAKSDDALLDGWSEYGDISAVIYHDGGLLRGRRAGGMRGIIGLRVGLDRRLAIVAHLVGSRRVHKGRGYHYDTARQAVVCFSRVGYCILWITWA